MVPLLEQSVQTTRNYTSFGQMSKGPKLKWPNLVDGDLDLDRREMQRFFLSDLRPRELDSLCPLEPSSLDLVDLDGRFLLECFLLWSGLLDRERCWRLWRATRFNLFCTLFKSSTNLGGIDLVCTQHRGEGGCPNACIVHKLM